MSVRISILRATARAAVFAFALAIGRALTSAFEALIGISGTSPGSLLLVAFLGLLTGVAGFPVFAIENLLEGRLSFRGRHFVFAATVALAALAGLACAGLQARYTLAVFLGRPVVDELRSVCLSLVTLPVHWLAALAPLSMAFVALAVGRHWKLGLLARMGLVLATSAAFAFGSEPLLAEAREWLHNPNMVPREDPLRHLGRVWASRHLVIYRDIFFPFSAILTMAAALPVAAILADAAERRIAWLHDHLESPES